MANRTIKIASLKENAVRIYQGMDTVFPNEGKSLKLYPEKLTEKFKKHYAVKGPTICFIDIKEVYATPYTDLVIRSLEAAGFKKADFYVPFSQGDYPRKEASKWVYLNEIAIQTYIDDLIEDCTTYSEENGIGYLRNKKLMNCIQIPFVGLPVIDQNGIQKCFYPNLNIGEIKKKMSDYVGRFCVNNNVVVFVYRDGRTYVTKGTSIIKELEAAGYTEKKMNVPLSEGEIIQIKTLQKRWEASTY